MRRKKIIKNKFGKQGTRLSNKELLIKYLKSKTSYIDDCWIYTGGSLIEDGHTRVNVDNKVIGVHRLSAYLFHGLDLNDKNLQANHKIECKSKICWNPEHVYIGTHKDNMNDYKMSDNFIGKLTHCKRGHLYPNLRNGRRKCRVCDYLMAALRYKRKKNAKN